MDTNRLNNIFAEQECITNQVMLKYLDNKLSEREKDLVEMHLDACDLCHDEIEGLRAMQDKDKLPEIVSNLNLKITKLTHSRKRFALFPQVTAMAATILLLVGFAWAFFYIIHLNPGMLWKNQLAQSDEISPEDELQKIIDDNRGGPIDIKFDDTKKIVLKQDNAFTKTENKHVRKDTEIAEVSDDLADPLKVTENIEEANITHNEMAQADEKNRTKESKIISADRKLNADSPITITQEQENKKVSLTTSIAVQTNWQKAVAKYNAKNYKQAIELFLKTDENQVPKDERFYYLATSYQTIDEHKKAIGYYNKLVTMPESKYYEPALWNKAQLLIKAGKTEEAIENLQLIRKLNGKFTDKAQNQLDSLIIR
jgi:tetratricopeptide (TPR) repeat protein